MEVNPAVVKVILTIVLSILSSVYIVWCLCQNEPPQWYRMVCDFIFFILPPSICTALIVLAWMYL